MTKKNEVKGKYGDLIQKAREGESSVAEGADVQTTRKPDNRITSEPENQKEREVNLCVKVPESLRRHWAAEAKRRGITMTEVIVEGLTKKFGKPDSGL